MQDPVEEVVAPAAIERALAIYQQLQRRDSSVLVQARKIITQHIFGMVDRGERDEKRLVVGALTQLKMVERDMTSSLHTTLLGKDIRTLLLRTNMGTPALS